MPYTDVRPPDGHRCPLPVLTSGYASKAAGLGSRWQCPACGAEWRLDAHETGTRSSTWSRLTAGGPVKRSYGALPWVIAAGTLLGIWLAWPR